ncbi:MAG: DUF790 family protein [Chloroflexi bacterium]|nr:DUF790 family protein [Chloroflexota bacterium]
MTFPLEWLRRSFVGGRGETEVRLWLPLGREAPAFARRVAAACRSLDSLVGRPRSALDEAAFDRLFSDYRTGRAALACLLEHYRYATPVWAEFAGPAAATALASRGIQSPSDLRLALYRRLAAPDGFVRSADRDPFLLRWAGELGVPNAAASHISDWLWADADTAAVLVAPPQPVRPEEVARRFTRRAVAGLLAHSRAVRLTMPDGGAWRRAYFLCRQAGLYAEPAWPSALAIAGPPEAVRSADVGERLAAVALSLVAVGATGSAHVLLFNRPYRFTLTAEIAAAIGPVEPPPPSFDSEVEAAFYRRFAGLVRTGRSRGWAIAREPEALRAGDAVLLPDFGVTRDGRTVFVEIVGHWTEDYRERKRARLQAVARSGAPPLLLIVAEPLLAAFADLPFPAVPYRDRVDAEALLDVLDRHFPQPDRPRTLARAAIYQARQTDGWLGFGALAANLSASPAEVEQAVATADLPAGLVLVPGLGLCSQAFLDRAGRCLEATVAEGGTSADVVAAALAQECGFAGALPALLSAFPAYRLNWSSLFEATVEVCDDRRDDSRGRHSDRPDL